MSTSPAQALPLSVPRASALYIGALFGPGLLLLPGLAAQQAGPASIIAWVALLGLSAIFATVFAALGRKVPGAAGAAGYAAAGLGRRARRADALVRGGGGGGPADRTPARGPAARGHRHRVHRARRALPGPGRGHGQLPGPRREPDRSARRPASAGHRPGRAGGGRRGRAGPHGRLGQRLHLGGERDAARADRRTRSEGAERAWPCAPAFG